MADRTGNIQEWKSDLVNFTGVPLNFSGKPS